MADQPSGLATPISTQPTISLGTDIPPAHSWPAGIASHTRTGPARHRRAQLRSHPRRSHRIRRRGVRGCSSCAPQLSRPPPGAHARSHSRRDHRGRRRGARMLVMCAVAIPPVPQGTRMLGICAAVIAPAAVGRGCSSCAPQPSRPPHQSRALPATWPRLPTYHAFRTRKLGHSGRRTLRK